MNLVSPIRLGRMFSWLPKLWINHLKFVANSFHGGKRERGTAVSYLEMTSSAETATGCSTNFKSCCCLFFTAQLDDLNEFLFCCFANALHASAFLLSAAISFIIFSSKSYLIHCIFTCRNNSKFESWYILQKEQSTLRECELLHSDNLLLTSMWLLSTKVLSINWLLLRWRFEVYRISTHKLQYLQLVTLHFQALPKFNLCLWYL